MSLYFFFSDAVVSRLTDRLDLLINMIWYEVLINPMKVVTYTYTFMPSKFTNLILEPLDARVDGAVNFQINLNIDSHISII